MSTIAAPTTIATATAPRRALSFVDLSSLLFLGAVWGGAFLFLRIAAPQVGPVWAAEFRLAIAAVVLVAFAGRRTLPLVRGRVVAFSIVGATFAAIPFTAIAFETLTLSTGTSALLNAATPLFTALLGVLVLKQRLSRRAVAGLAIGVVAVLVLVGWSPLQLTPATLLAVAAGLVAPFSYAVAGTFVRVRMHGVGGVELATGMLVAAAILTLPVAILSGTPRLPHVDGAISLVAVGIVSTALAWPIFYRVHGRTTPTVASTATFIVPVFATAWGALALGEAVGPELVVGFGLVLVSLVLVLGLPVPSPASLASRLRALPAAIRPRFAVDAPDVLRGEPIAV